MRTPEQVRRDFVNQWLAKANGDLTLAQRILANNFESFDAVGFHAQQAAEKFMKAFLVRHQIEFPKTHNISTLRGLIEKVDKKLADKLTPAEILTAYGVEYRYPDVYEATTAEKAREAVEQSETDSALINDELESYLKSESESS